MGASSGIGLEVAREFAKRGVHLGLASRNTSALEELKREYPSQIEYEPIDVNDPEAPRRLNDLISKLGGMDVYFHVSGIGYDNPDLEPAREAEVINTNAAGFARMIAAAYRYFKTNGRTGRIAAVTSVAGTNGIAQLSAYSASKKCASTYMVALEQRAHIEKVNVKFTDIRPGWIRTPLLKEEKKYPLEITLQEAVPMIIRAIVKCPRVAYIGPRWGVIASIWRLIPDCLWVRMNIDK